MPLVEYSDSEGSVNSDSAPSPAVTSNAKRKRAPSPSPADSAKQTLPPLPSTFHDLYASASRLSNTDDPSLHAGRQRQIPHVEGNWPSHVYIEWIPTTEQYTLLESIVDQVNKRRDDVETDGRHVHSLLRSDLGAPLPLHISLSRPIVLRGEQRHDFLHDLTARIRKLGMQPFTLHAIHGADWVANHDDTRWFLVLRLERDKGDSLNKLLWVSNQTVKEYGQFGLYEKQIPLPADRQMPNRKQRRIGGSEEADLSMHFHISIAWTLASPRVEEQTRVLGPSEGGSEEEGLGVNVEVVKVKIGNNINSVALADVRSTAANGILA
ncbi:MAG: poly(U)-specific 3'-to-5' RNA exonuclease [Ramalina farinacea]|uniref:U6 snRNA phosphodiesterase n=1 Tax=Ramalina farinacea TaxID=258253 RepID=A0AA43QKK5_9LECA|nr:poly(U)-specific 3'-to-5' RNA exonuclease [Ramalina farinacea]